MKPVVFISHIHSEANVAIWLKESFSKLLLGGIDFFVSSDRSSIIGGDKWLDKIEEGLKNTSILLVLCSKDSVSRPWINFEAGGAWMAGKRVVPVCHTGMHPSDLPQPLGSLQAYELSNPDHLQDLVSLLANEAGLDSPSFDAKALADYVPDVETDVELELLQIPETGEKVGTGWIMPTPDPRDITHTHESVAGLKKKLNITKDEILGLPSAIDLRSWCSEIRNQGKLNSGTAQAVIGLLEYFQRRRYGGHSVDLSCRFLYKLARNLMHLKGDSGASLRSTLKAAVKFGIPPNEHWPYTDKKPDFDEDPPTWLYEYAVNFQFSVYFCHDPLHLNFPPEFVLARVKSFLAAGVPSVFGFYIFPSFSITNIGRIPFPCPGEEQKWKQAVLAVGYDDAIKIKNSQCDVVTVGALLIKNSWGKEWGENGYGWIPYDYILRRQAHDFWTVLNPEWIDTGQFGL